MHEQSLCEVTVRDSQVIEDTEHNSKAHVDDPDNNGHLHLVGVEEGQSIHCHVPYLTKYHK